MRIRFWGTRGSIPVAMTSAEVQRKLVTALVAAAGRGLDTAGKARAFVETELDFSVSHTFGGNSSCVQIEPDGSDYVLCDLGSGARGFGNSLLATRGPSGHRFHVFMSHLHWDHIMGFPFFGPAYLREARIRIHGCHEALEHAFRLQQDPPCFPVPFSQLGATIEFIHLDPRRTHEIGGVRVTPNLQFHSGDSYGFRFERDGKSFVYTTDSEHKLDNNKETRRIVGFFRGADLVIFDAMYSLAEAVSVKADWGHSSNVVGVELCQMARAKKLALFHHEPANDDSAIARILRDARRLEELTRGAHALEVVAAYDGLEIDL